MIRTGELVKCDSFLELLTAPPLKGYGEDPKRVEALLKDDAEALRMFREAITPPKHRHRAADASNRSITHGTTRAYTLTRLHAHHAALYQRVVDGELSAHAAAIQAGIRKPRTLLEQMEALWRRLSTREPTAFFRRISMTANAV